jgi:hypothetical protein
VLRLSCCLSSSGCVSVQRCKCYYLHVRTDPAVCMVHGPIIMRHLSCNGCKNCFLGGRRPYNLCLWECPVKTLASLRRLLIVQPIATYMANYKHFMCALRCPSPHAVQVMAFVSLLQTSPTQCRLFKVSICKIKLCALRWSNL